ncbi:hypothetical protein [Ferribacterium limneticum]|uniref:hypothetical protein n=1 Tax=Ferribacterium limneticum TaxID=76259 RepID=UPI001CFA86F4|nr:hypothetical protein [Ferribacterium limneticum]UCV17236.1 hypothetical protein KI610_10280 [Ferribacterium limneticum]
MPDFTNNAIKLGGVISQRPPFRPPPNLWRTVTITFDDVPSGTAVDSTYAGSGVTLASVTYPPRTWSAFAKEMPWGGGQSGKNVLTIIEADPSYPWFDARYGALEATFSQLQQSVSVWAYAMNSSEGAGNADNRPFMEAYDSTGKYLGKVLTQLGVHDANFLGHWHPLSFSSTSRNIAKVRLSSQANGLPWTYAAFDNLTFDRNILIRP